jgi:hypothetical protein
VPRTNLVAKAFNARNSIVQMDTRAFIGDKRLARTPLVRLTAVLAPVLFAWNANIYKDEFARLLLTWFRIRLIADARDHAMALTQRKAVAFTAHTTVTEKHALAKNIGDREGNQPVKALSSIGLVIRLSTSDFNAAKKTVKKIKVNPATGTDLVKRE